MLRFRNKLNLTASIAMMCMVTTGKKKEGKRRTYSGMECGLAAP
jgi:hypothetical protein